MPANPIIFWVSVDSSTPCSENNYPRGGEPVYNQDLAGVLQASADHKGGQERLICRGHGGQPIWKACDFYLESLDGCVIMSVA